MRHFKPYLFVSIAAAASLLTAPGAALGAPSPDAPEKPEKMIFFQRPRGPVPPPIVKGPKLAISLREAVTLALSRNFEITIEAFNPRIREKEIKEQNAVFDPAITSELKTSKAKLDTPSGLFSGGGQITISEQEGSAGITQKIMTGAEYSLLFSSVRENSSSRQKVINPDFESRLTFTITQPLLKNYGIDVNKAEIRLASFSRDQSMLIYRDRVISVVNDVEQAYWDLVFSISNLGFRKKSLDLAKDLLRRNRIQVEVGTLAPIEILEAQAAVAARGEEVIVAERQVKDRDDALKKLLNISKNVSSWNIQVTPKDKPTLTSMNLDEMGSTLTALQKRADLKSARLEIEKNKVRLNRDRQNLLPQLDLSASAANQGIDRSFGKSVDRESGNKGYVLSGGLSFRYPIGNQAAKAKLDKTRLQLQQANTSFSQLEQSIIEEVRRSIRRARTDRKRIEASRLARRLAKERLDSQEKKLKVGLSTSRDVLEDQESLANALSNEVQALVDYNKSLAQLGRVTYSSLKRYRIFIGDPRKSAQSAAP